MVLIGAIYMLVLLVYLPTLIWSPPWSGNGYYRHSSSYQHFEDEIITEWSMSENNYTQEKYTFILENGAWICTEPSILSGLDSLGCRFSDGNLHVISILGDNLIAIVCKRIHNPFTPLAYEVAEMGYGVSGDNKERHMGVWSHP